jgi:hypothetical protein
VKLSDFTPEQWYGRLNAKRLRQRDKALTWWQYMDLEQPLVYVARILAEQSDRFPPLLLGWPELVVEAVEERLILEAFLLSGADSPVEELTEWWQGNDLDEYSSEAHTAAMTSGQQFVMVGPGDGDIPLITVEYEDQVAVEVDPRTRQPVAGLKVWQEDDGGGDTLGALHLWGGRSYEFRNGEVENEVFLGDWAVRLEEDHTLPSVPVLPMLTGPRRGCGRSDLVAIKPLVDAANQTATNMMASIEHHAVSRKWAVGLSEKDFVDEDGNQIPLWKIATGDVWAVPFPEQQHRDQAMPEIKLGQFSQSDLRNFHESLKVIAIFAASKYGLPVNYMGYSSDNPPSAESILYSLDRLVRRTEKRQLWYGGTWERVNRIAWALMDNDPAKLRRLESKWRNAATPTLASMMDAAVKGVTAGIIDDEQAWIDLQYSEETKRGLRDRKRARGLAAAATLSAVDQIPTTLPDTPAAPSTAVPDAPALAS